jgi:hypothetical protein
VNHSREKDRKSRNDRVTNPDKALSLNAYGATSDQASTVKMLCLELAEEQQAIKNYATQIAQTKALSE